MVFRITSALSRLAVGASATALEALSDLTKWLPGEAQVAALIEQVADQFEKIEVRVTCRPTGRDANDYRLEVDLKAFETALTAGRIAQPKIVVVAATANLNRTLLTERLIESFAVVLLEHQAKTDTVRKQRERRLKREADARDSFLWDIIEAMTWLLIFPLAGFGAAVGTVFWLIVGFGGIMALMELPGLVLTGLKRSVGLGKHEDETELERLEKDLKRYEAVLLRMVTRATVTEDPALQMLRQQF